MARSNLALMAHLLRRAGFGESRQELERYVAQGYESTVEELLHPENAPPALEDEDLIRRYHIDQNSLIYVESCQAYWLYRMINTRRPLEEKLALFWHHIFATGYTKLNQPKAILKQVEMFRRHGLGSFRDLLVHISRDPAMIFWLDNKDNHKDAVNENYGREILELFSMGVGNYTEDDVRQCSRAFTGWTIHNAPLHTSRVSRDSVWPYGRLDWQFQYRADDHDHGDKAFLGARGDFDGEDVIDIICANPATARFLARHLYNFFVEDEAQVPAWQTVAPKNADAVNTIAAHLIETDYDMRSTLRMIFNSDFFKHSAFRRVKSPVEMIVGSARITRSFGFPEVEDISLGFQSNFMGQRILDPPSVEGWHTGTEWINTAGLVNRINFAVDLFSDETKPGVRSIIDGIRAQGNLSTREFVDVCLEMMGCIEPSARTRSELDEHAAMLGDLRFDEGHDDDFNEDFAEPERRIIEMMQLIAATREYQLA
ncbi:MAG: DUF1800 domain-containing protein [Chloroflexi bacterium]|nr:DUF1800 domain-containing protein [Chloroflexota bacterium]